MEKDRDTILLCYSERALPGEESISARTHCRFKAGCLSLLNSTQQSLNEDTTSPAIPFAQRRDMRDVMRTMPGV